MGHGPLGAALGGTLDYGLESVPVKTGLASGLHYGSKALNFQGLPRFAFPPGATHEGHDEDGKLVGHVVDGSWVPLKEDK